ncbi:MAG: oligopeptide transporter, OPT family [Acidaminobacteraceae bacterium]
MDENSFRPFVPFIPAHKSMPELTIVSIALGVLLAIVFGIVNAYLGLKVGMTISASIPAAVVSMSIMRVLMKRDSILENNMVQTIASAGESLTAGAIFTIPAIFLWSASNGFEPPSMLLISLIGASGGILGVMFMIPLRKALIVKEHDYLPYPEGSACAEVLLAGEEGGDKAKSTFIGMLVGGFYKIISDGVGFIPSKINFFIKKPITTMFGLDALPALLGVGFIIGRQISSYMFAGSLIGWIVIIPLIVLIGDLSVIPLSPATLPISMLSTNQIWSFYIRYIGAGAVAFGGFFSLFKTFPMILETFTESLRDYNDILRGKEYIRTDKDIPMPFVIATILIVTILLVLIPVFKIGLVGAVFITVIGFFFATVSSRIVGYVGSSSNPISGMTLASLMLAAFVYKFMGYVGTRGILAVFTVSSIICIIISMSGDTSQDLKTGYLVGATPYKQQIGEIIGVITMSLVLGGVLILFNNAWGFGSPELPAPQATLIKIIVEGVMQGDLPWAFIGIGIGIGIIVEIVGIPILPVAIGLYLPIQLTTTIFIGGLVRGMINKNKDGVDTFESKNKEDAGILYSSGLIAGEGIVGVLFAILAVIGIQFKFPINGGVLGTIVAFLIIIYTLMRNSVYKKYR